MQIGKLPNEVLRYLILDKIKNTRSEVLVNPAIGEDCSVIDLGQELCVLSSDPITGTENEIGRIAVHVSCNDIAASGAEPIGLMVTLLITPDAPSDSVEKFKPAYRYSHIGPCGYYRRTYRGDRCGKPLCYQCYGYRKDHREKCDSNLWRKTGRQLHLNKNRRFGGYCHPGF